MLIPNYNSILQSESIVHDIREAELSCLVPLKLRNSAFSRIKCDAFVHPFSAPNTNTICSNSAVILTFLINMMKFISDC